MKNAGASFLKFLPVSLVLISVLVSAQAAFGQSPPKTWAVVIGISKYPGLPGGQQLQFAERDAQSFASSLQSSGLNPANIKLLLGQQANLAGIKEALGSWLARSAGPQDTAIIFFSGHGYVEHSFDEAYLLAEDSRPQNVFATALSLADIKHVVEARIKAGRVIILQDSVRKDLFDPDSDGPGLTETFFKAAGEIAAAKPNTSIIIASSPGEFSWEGRRWGEMGVFTKMLIEGMTGRADRNGDGSVTDLELFRFLSDQVPAETSGKQHPWRTITPVTEAVLARGQRAGSPLGAPKAADSSAASRRNNTPAGVQTSAGQPAAIASSPSERQNGSQDRPDASRRVTAQPAPAAPSTTQTTLSPASNSQVDSANRPVSRAPGPPSSPGSRSTGNGKPKSTGAESKPADSPVGELAAAPGIGVRNTNTEARPSPLPPARVPAESPAPGSAAPSKTTPVRSQPIPPSIATAEPSGPSTAPGGPPAGIGTREAPAPPRPDVLLPNPASIATSPEPGSRGPVGRLAVESAGATPSPLVLQLELALDRGSLVTPSGSSAWDLYQKLSVFEPPAKEMPQLKSRLMEGLLVNSKAIVLGDVRTDSISSSADDLRMAGQMLTRLQRMQPNNPEISRLQKLSAAEALISLQFYDEALKALEPIRTPPAGAVENALGLAAVGQLSDFEAERHFKRAIELEPKWAAPHYNLALLYRNQKKDASLAEFEQAARLDASNPAILSSLGDECFERKQWAEAATAYRAGLAIKPDDDALHTKLGHALYSQGLRNEADKEYQRARELADRRK